MDQAPEESKNTENHQNIPFWRVVLSVIQASFGVQSNRNRTRDFASKSIWPYVAAAMLFVLAFVFILVLVVKLALPD